MLEELNRLAKQEKLIVECLNGEEFPVEKVYSVSGRASAIKILVGGDGKTNKLLDKIDDLEHDLKVSEEEKESAESELEKVEKELYEIEEKHQKELDKIENYLENAEQFLGFKTSERLIHYRIEELARKINEKNLNPLKKSENS